MEYFDMPSYMHNIVGLFCRGKVNHLRSGHSLDRVSNMRRRIIYGQLMSVSVGGFSEFSSKRTPCLSCTQNLTTAKGMSAVFSMVERDYYE